MRVAVVGSGVSGLAATWLLNEYSDHEVHLYESDHRPGGHANTIRFTPSGKDEEIDVDTGFIVFNPSTYPNFIQFLHTIGLSSSIVPTEMTFSVSRDSGAFEWAGKDLSTIFCQRSRLLDGGMWRMIYDVLRFNACARRLIAQWHKDDSQPNSRTVGKETELSIGQYLDREGYSQEFRDDYLIPMTACIWSTPPDTCTLDFPARTLIQFMHNHHLLQITGKPSWLTLKGGSKIYVSAILSRLPPSSLRLSTPVTSISGTGQKVTIKTADEVAEYDHVIVATHSDAALQMLENGETGATTMEREVLGRFKWSKNRVVVHSDEDLMPRHKSAWSCWNFLTESVIDEEGKKKPNADRVSLTYGMNDLQHFSLDRHGPILVTMNPPFEPDADKTITEFTYDHPVLNGEAIVGQRLLPTIQNQRHISFAGAYTNYGFHEDGFTSGLNAVLEYSNLLSPSSVSAQTNGSITNKNRSRLPFEVTYPARDPGSLWAASVFDFFEKSRARELTGSILGQLLGIGRWVFGNSARGGGKSKRD